MKKYELIVEHYDDGIHITAKERKLKVFTRDNITIFISMITIFISTYYVLYNIDKFTTTLK
jgi:hypothetical protein